MDREWLIEARDNATLERTGQLDDFQRLEVVPRFNAFGAWTLRLPVEAALSFDEGIVISVDGQEFFSGPVGYVERVWEGDEDAVEVGGFGDGVWLHRRLAYPEAPALTTSTDGHDVRSGVCSTVLREYVDANAGPGAHSSRQVDGLTIGSDPLLGENVTGRGRFQTVEELIRGLALAGGDLGFRIVQEDGSLVFRVYQPEDKTADVRFSAELGNLAAFTYREDAPEANFVVVGGGGEEEARVFVVGGDSESISRYQRIESFRDRRDTSNATELGQARDEELAETAQRESLAATPVDTAAFRFLTDYGLGDRVTVEVDGTPIQEVLREVQVTLEPARGETIVPVIGSPGERDPRVPRLYDRLRRLERKLTDLERRR